jgi:hypothetical protein
LAKGLGKSGAKLRVPYDCNLVSGAGSLAKGFKQKISGKRFSLVASSNAKLTVENQPDSFARMKLLGERIFAGSEQIKAFASLKLKTY